MKFTGGLPETLCGTGSTLAATAYLRERLPLMLADLGIEILLDAPCGDMNWISAIDLSGITYIGADSSAENLAAARERNKHVVLHQLDIVTDDLPPADGMLCRDFHQHLPHRLVVSALRNFVASGITWLLATSHLTAPNKDILRTGSFRSLSLTAPPYKFGNPVYSVADGSNRILGAWRREQVIEALNDSSKSAC